MAVAELQKTKQPQVASQVTGASTKDTISQAMSRAGGVAQESTWQVEDTIKREPSFGSSRTETRPSTEPPVDAVRGMPHLPSVTAPQRAWDMQQNMASALNGVQAHPTPPKP